ncbi:MAG: hypothetical protein DRN20_01600 [Thermoplasmata archaeon]|nr:MAG: hypothetical protein DRN20_01600 [Thermoplasmata archaeon]
MTLDRFANLAPFDHALKEAAWTFKKRYDDIITSAPQRFFRMLKSSLEDKGYVIRTGPGLTTPDDSLLSATAISDVGYVEGRIIAEKSLIMPTIWRVIRGTGILIIIGGLLTIVDSLETLFSTSNLDVILWAKSLTSAFSILVLGASIFVKSKRFKSYIIWLDVRGEAYKTSLSLDTGKKEISAGAERVLVL